MKQLAEIPWGVIAPLIVIQLIIMLIALVDWLKAKETNGSKWMWLPIIIFITILGPILYFVIGRRQD